MVFRNFLGTTFFAVAKGDLLGFSARFGAQALEEIQGPGRKQKNIVFPELGALLGGGIRPPQTFLSEFAHLFYILGFGRPDPHGRKIAKYWFFRPFWLGVQGTMVSKILDT